MTHLPVGTPKVKTKNMKTVIKSIPANEKAERLAAKFNRYGNIKIT